ncbi:MAG TPA: alpha/beta hydrolase [Marinilabiliales bacterium]|nr:alpha/beta hydrolase [Marinilabiliales bacterium]
MAKLHFRSFGEGAPMIILHGLYGSSDNWVSLARELMADFKVYLVDLRNHGASPHLPEHSYPAMVDDLVEFMNDQHLYQAILVGHSMGGKVAMSFAGLYPEKVKNLVVVDISPRTYSETNSDKQLNEHQQIVTGLSSIDLTKVNDRLEVDALLANFVSSEKIRQFLMKNLHRNKDKTFHWKLNVPAIAAHLPSVLAGLESEASNFAHFQQPVLFIKGSESNYIQENDVFLIQSLFKNVRIVTIAGASHWVHAEAPEVFLFELKKFLL